MNAPRDVERSVHRPATGPDNAVATVVGTAVALALPALGFGWLAGAVATGLRYPGLSLAWLVPAALAGALTLLGVAAFARLARWAGVAHPWRVAAAAAAPLWLAWGIVLSLLLSDGANHYFANWVRLRSAAVVVLLALQAASAGLATLSLLETRSGAVSRLAQRTGIPALVFAGTLAVLLASAGGHLYTPDEWTIYGAAAGLVTHGVPAAYADEPYPLHLLGGLASPAERARAAADPLGTLRRVFPKYGILPSILAAPAYAIARVAGPGPDLPKVPFPFENRALPLVPVLVNPLLTAATAALLYQVAIALRYTRRAALVAAGGYLFGSLAWPYSKTLLNMTPAGLALLAAFWCVLRARAASANDASAQAVAAASGGSASAESASGGPAPGSASAWPPARATRPCSSARPSPSGSWPSAGTPDGQTPGGQTPGGQTPGGDEGHSLCPSCCSAPASPSPSGHSSWA
jgi:hypothetical protein